MSNEPELNEVEILSLLAAYEELDTEEADRLEAIQGEASDQCDKARVIVQDVNAIPEMPLVSLSEHTRRRIERDLKQNAVAVRARPHLLAWAVAAAAVICFFAYFFPEESSSLPSDVSVASPGFSVVENDPIDVTPDTASNVFDSSAWDKHVSTVENKVLEGFSRPRPIVNRKDGHTRQCDALRRRMEQLKSSSLFEG